MTAAEPWREQPAPPPKTTRLARDSDEPANASEFGWGPGLVPKHANGRPPSEGGMYTPKCPPVELRGNSLTPRQKPRRKGEVRGYPGDRIA